jgi:uncharacterized cupredoxin-like copper-binding protein
VTWNVTFSQVATNAAVICPVAGHAAAGMTERFNVSQGARVIEVHLHDSGVTGDRYQITPATIDLTPGEVVVFHVFNDGTVDHNLHLGDPYNIVSATIPKNKDTFTAPITVAATSDHYWCDIAGHREFGMEGTFSGAQAETGPQVPGFDAVWAIPALVGVAGLLVWRRRHA